MTTVVLILEWRLLIDRFLVRAAWRTAWLVGRDAEYAPEMTSKVAAQRVQRFKMDAKTSGASVVVRITKQQHSLFEAYYWFHEPDYTRCGAIEHIVQPPEYRT